MKFTFFLFFFFIYALNINAQNNVKSDSISLSCCKHDTVPQEILETGATFQGGDLLKFKKHITSQLIFPMEANMREWSGKTYVRFIVNWDGKVKDVSVYKSSGYKVLDDEAFRVVKASPVWTPGQLNGVYVPQIFIIPIIFKALGVTRYETTGPTYNRISPSQYESIFPPFTK
jgi:TonB family protein